MLVIAATKSDMLAEVTKLKDEASHSLAANPGATGADGAVSGTKPRGRCRVRSVRRVMNGVQLEIDSDSEIHFDQVCSYVSQVR